MKILILGSTGRTGQELVKQALSQSHDVTALARDPTKLNIAHEKLTVIKGDVLDKDLLSDLVPGKDAVISALGAGKSLKSKDLIANVTRLLIPEMEENNVGRLIFLSAFGVGESIRQASFIQRAAFKLFLGNIFSDKLKGEDMIRRSRLDWTLIYPVVLTNSAATGNYKVGEKLEMKGMPKISRADVADFMLRQAKEDRFVRKTAVIMSLYRLPSCDKLYRLFF